jgi:hypothetical protein
VTELVSTPENERPVVVFDVDGVLRVDAEVKPEGYVAQDQLPFAYNPALSIPLQGLVKVTNSYYISSWREQCHEHIGKILGLPELDWINSDGYEIRPGKESERAQAIAGLFTGRPVAWIDDEITEADHEWADERSRTIAPTLSMRTDPDIGLTPRGIVLVESWLAVL